MGWVFRVLGKGGGTGVSGKGMELEASPVYLTRDLNAVTAVTSAGSWG